jgi:chromosome segregation ATPase
MISFPISHRILMKILLCGVILAFIGVGAGGITDDEIDSAVNVATAGLQREMTSLQEQLELFEMKHETLQAASEQFRMQSKSAKTKLEEERRRYDILASEKLSLEMSIESKVTIALEDQEAAFEDTIETEHVAKQNLLAKENEVLTKKLRGVEYQMSLLEDSMKEKLDEQSKRFEISEGKRLASEGKLRNKITTLTKTLSYTEKQAKSFEESWKKAVVESEEKDDYFQEEAGKRLNEARRWEQRLQKLNAESKDLYEENKAKEIELIRSRKIHMTLLEKLQLSDEQVKLHESKIETFTADIEKLSYDMVSASGELTQSKKDHALLSDRFENLNDLHQDTEFILKSVRKEGERNAAKNAELRNELVDLKFELETSQNRTKLTIEEKSEMTKAYTEALNQLTSKNNFLRYELVDIKIQLEQSQNETDTLSKEASEITNAHMNALDRLESESKKLKSLQQEYSSLRRDFEIITDQFNESEGKVKHFKLRIEEEAAENEKLQKELLYTGLKVENSQKNEEGLSDENSELLKMYEEIQRTLEISEMKLLQTEQQYKKGHEHVEMLEGNVHELEGKAEKLLEQLEMKVAKNTYLQKSLLDTRYNLEESQSKVMLLEAQRVETSTSDEHLGVLEIENQKMMERAKALERELQESSALYNGASRKISDLQDQLNANENRSIQILNMYESLKDENDVLSRSLRSTEEYNKSEFNSANLELQEKNESFEQCDKDLRDTQVEYSKLMQDYDAAKERIGETEQKVLSQEDAIKELKIRQSELEMISAKRENDLERSELPEELDTAKDLVDEECNDGVADEVENDETEENESTSEAPAVEVPVKDINDSESTTGRNERETQEPFSFFKWLDYALYTILRVIVDLIGFLANGLWQMVSSSTFIVRLITPFESLFAIASWTLNEFRIVHDALVSLFEFEMTFVSSLVPADKDRTGFLFLIRHSQMFVMFGEAIAFLLCIDFVVSSFLIPIRGRKRRPRAKTIHVPKTANASLLRKANNL